MIKEKWEKLKEWIKEHKKAFIVSVFFIFAFLLLIYYIVLIFDYFLRGNGLHVLLPITEIVRKPKKELIQIYGITIFSIFFYIWFTYNKPYKSDMQTIAGVIRVPKKAGSNEHGSARFLTEHEREKEFETILMDKKNEWLCEAGKEDSKNIENQAKIITHWNAKKKEIIEKYRGKDKKELIKEFAQLEKEKEQILISWNQEDERREKKYQAYKNKETTQPFKYGGVVLNWKKTGESEKIQVMEKNRHMILLGPTRSGKNRNILFQSIGMTALAGNNALIADVKGENYLYTHKFLKRIGYKTYTLDFREPKKSIKYNFLQPIINAVDENNLAEAVNLCWDLTAQLVGEPKGERIWTDGEAAMIAGSIMAVVYDNQLEGKRQYQNLTNVYHFIFEMAETIDDKGHTKVQEYANKLPDSHPSKAIFGITKVAPRRTAGSFYTAALATLRLFTNQLIYEMSRETTLNLEKVFDEKTMIFLILPDEKKTYHPVATLFISMFYQIGVKKATESGGRVPITWNMFLDEFGNFTKIVGIDFMLTAAAGRGFYYLLVLQSFSQLEEKYGKEFAQTIKDNCEIWIYLNSNDDDTKKKFSERLGNYTIYSFSKSTSYDRHARMNGNTSSANLTSRELLKPDELGMIKRPYMIVSSGRTTHFVSYSPDISKWAFNDIYGLGTESHNEKVMLTRNWQRKEEEPEEIQLWGIWKTIKKGQDDKSKYNDNWVAGQETIL